GAWVLVEAGRAPGPAGDGAVGGPADVGVVAEHRGQLQSLAEPGGQREVVPAGDLVRLDDALRGVVDRAPKADAHAAQVRAQHARRGEQLWHRREDLPADALAAGLRVDGAAPAPQESTVAGPDAELELGAADLDAQKHGGVMGQGPGVSKQGSG